MNLGLEGKTALVLASSKGLGRAIAQELALEGAKLMISSRSEGALKAAAGEIRSLTGAEVAYQVCDLTEGEQIQALVEETATIYGSIDVLVNNAGGPPAGNFSVLVDEDWDYAFRLNLLSYIRAIREVLPHIRGNGQGKIVNIASYSVKQSIEGLILGNTMRTGIVGLAKTLSRELAADNILINTVGPGRIATDRVEHLDGKRSEELQMSYEEVRSLAEQDIPLGRYGTPQEFAKLVVFLCSQVNTYMTGQVILVDGGLTTAL